MMKKILNVYIKSLDNSCEIPNGCRSSIEIIGKTVLAAFIKRIPGLEINIVGSGSNNNIIKNFEYILVINTFDLSDFDLIKKFEKRIYFFDDLNIWKIDNYDIYRDNLIFDYYWIPNEDKAIELSNRLENVFYVPYSSLDSFDHTCNTVKTLQASILIDIWPKTLLPGCERGVTSLSNAIEFFQIIQALKCDIYVHEMFSQEIFGENVHYITEMPRDEFQSFIKKMWFYATSIIGSYEFVILESTVNGALCIDIKGSVNSEHLKSHAVISDTFFCENSKRILADFSPIKNSENARLVYDSILYRQVCDEVFKC